MTSYSEFLARRNLPATPRVKEGLNRGADTHWQTGVQEEIRKTRDESSLSNGVAAIVKQQVENMKIYNT